MVVLAPPPAVAARPVVTFNDKMSFHLNGEEVRAFLAPPAHTDGDTFVYFPDSDVLHLGDVYRTTSYPIIDMYNGGTLRGTIAPNLPDTLISVPSLARLGYRFVFDGKGGQIYGPDGSTMATATLARDAFILDPAATTAMFAQKGEARKPKDPYQVGDTEFTRRIVTGCGIPIRLEIRNNTTKETQIKDN